MRDRPGSPRAGKGHATPLEELVNASQDSTGDRTPGFVGLLAAGYTPAEAWQVIRDDLAAHP